MNQAFIESSNIITSLGWTAEENYQRILSGESGLIPDDYPHLSVDRLPLSLLDNEELEKRFAALEAGKDYTRFEKLAILSAHDALLQSSVDPRNKKTLFILSTTKGSVNMMDHQGDPLLSEERLTLWKTAEVIGEFFGFVNKPMVISNACISGVLALVTAQRFIQTGAYDQVVVTGADEITRFIVSGFQSFKSLSSNPCKPFDANRDGLSLGEGAATAVLTSNPDQAGKERIELVRGASSNDANHISGPSRDGGGLLIAIQNTLQGDNRVDYISSHGTATPYNDDMESKALFRAGLSDIPATGTKGYTGHSLGAAGIIESLIGVEALKQNQLIKTLGCDEPGVAEPIHIVRENENKEIFRLLKIASGFGGCNAAALFVKHA